ncbi:hypothetical protein GALL_395750 [mine drainage metagenome]|jgi:hypothetical protein|uniref:Transmembrane protein n=1 Tax=mine drainage metagenome TaxID=410659 RepID=A0A1J5Q4Q6_9ZZZZ
MSRAFRHVPAGRALHWWAEGWRAFRRAPLAWLGLSVALVLMVAVLGVLPLGPLLVKWLLPPLFAFGAVFAASLQQRWRGAPRDLPAELIAEVTNDGAFDESARLWRARIKPLLLASILVVLLGGVFGIAFVALAATLLGVGLAGVGALGALAGSAGLLAGAGAMAGAMATLTLLGLVALVVVSVAFWFVGTLVTLGGADAWEAIVLSLRAALANVGALALFSLLLLPAAMLVLATMGLGVLVLLPVLSAASYASFDDVFGAAEARPRTEPNSL